MAWLFPARGASAQARQLDTIMAAHLASNEALSRAANDAKASARVEEENAQAITDAAQERLSRQDERRRRRRAQIETLQGVLDRPR